MVRAVLLLFVLNFCCSYSYQVSAWENIDNAKLKTVFEEIENAYEKNKSYTVDMEHVSYEDHLTQTEFQRIKGFYKKDGNNSYEYIVGVRTVQNNKYRVVINDEEKTILVASPVKLKNTGTDLMNEKLLDAALKGIKHKKDGEQDVYRIEFKDGFYLSAYELYVNKTKLVSRLRMFFDAEVKKNPEMDNSEKTKPRLEIIFSNYKLGQKSEASLFDEKKYFIEKDNNLKKAEAYSDYELIDTRLKY